MTLSIAIQVKHRGNYRMDNRRDADKPATGDLRQRAREQAEHIAEEGRERADSLKSRVGEEAGRAASALGSAASEFDAEGQERVAELLADFSRKLGDFASQVKHKSLDELLEDGSRLARNNPVLFLAGSVAAGAVLSRFFKAHAPSHGSRASGRTGTSRADESHTGYGGGRHASGSGPLTQADAPAAGHTGSPSTQAGSGHSGGAYGADTQPRGTYGGGGQSGSSYGGAGQSGGTYGGGGQSGGTHGGGTQSGSGPGTRTPEGGKRNPGGDR